MIQRDPNIILNGRFMTRPMKGVGRVAGELTDALIELLSETGQSSISLALPGTPLADPDSWPSSVMGLERVAPSFRTGHMWEQRDLSGLRQDEWLLNLCNTGPMLRRKQAVMIHDAQAFSQKESYSLAFRSLYRVLLPVLARRAQVLLTVSDFSRKELETLGVFPRGKARVVYNGVDHFDRIKSDPATLQRHGLESGRYLLALGSLAPHKNIKLLVAAARSRKISENMPLIIAGGKATQIFRTEGLSDGGGVRFLGHVSDAELKALYQNACALTFPSLTEGFGLPPLEAMSCNCPVVATSAGAVPEVCGDAALFVDPTRQGDWTAAMEHIAGQNSLRSELISKGKIQAEKFTWRRAAIQIIQAIQEKT